MPTFLEENERFWFYWDQSIDEVIASSFPPIEPNDSQWSNRCRICDAYEGSTLREHHCNKVIAYHILARTICKDGKTIEIASKEEVDMMLARISMVDNNVINHPI